MYVPFSRSSRGSGVCVPCGAGLVLVAEQELARLQRTPRAVRLQHAIAGIRRRVRALDRRLRDRIGKAEVLALRPDPVFMRERHRVLDEPDLDAAGRLHLGANDPRRLFAALVGIGANPRHRVDVGTAEAALPVLRRMRPDVADGTGAAPHADPERLGKAVQRPLREPERLQPFVGEADVDGEPRPMLFRAGR